MVKHLLFGIIITVLVSCKGANHSAAVANQPLIINIQRFSDLAEEEVNYVSAKLHKIFPNITINKKISLPQSAYYSKRNRYRADSLLKFLRRLTLAGHVTIGLTGKDISHTKGDIKDYGIMGLGYRPGNACMVSTFRVSKNNKLNQFFKFCIHELGHTAGLDHCVEKTCFMRDAKGHNPANEETDFCNRCKTYLIAKGWNLKTKIN